MFKMMIKYSKGFRLQTILTPILIAIEVLFEVLIPTMMTYIVRIAGNVAVGLYQYNIAGNEFWDEFLRNYPIFASGKALLWTLGAICILLSLMSLFMGILAGRTSAKAAAGFAANLRLDLFSKIQQFSFFNIDKFSTSGLVTRCTTDINHAQQCFQQLIRIVVRAPFMLVMATIFAFNLNSNIAWMFFLSIPLLAIAMTSLSFIIFPRYRKMLKLYDHMNKDVQENLVAVRVVKSFVREDYEQQKYNATAEKVRFAQLAAEKVMVFANPICMFIMYASIVTIVLLGGNQIIAGEMQGEVLSALITYSMQALMSVLMVCFVAVQLIMSRASVQRINEALKEVPDIENGNSANTVNSGSIVFEDVDFSYSKNSQNLTLSNINLTIKAGQTVGIVGGTGEGKSSLVQLIPRFYDVMRGKVLVDGTDVRDFDITTLRDAVSMVLQKNELFSGTIEQNLRWGNENATTEQIETACKAACAHDFVTSFPNGYQTELGQGGVNVSGGQKQRLCIARALLKDPKIMILDDSTSAVDTATDASIRSELKKHFKDMTVIIIAQRISSIVDCDQIVVLNEGKISQTGTHEQLLKTSEIYKEVYLSQQKGAAENE